MRHVCTRVHLRVCLFDWHAGAGIASVLTLADPVFLLKQAYCSYFEKRMCNEEVQRATGAPGDPVYSDINSCRVPST